MVNGVIFDFDGLLADTEESHLQAYKEVLSTYDISLTKEEYISHWIQTGGSLDSLLIAKDKHLVLDASTIKSQKDQLYLELIKENNISPMPGAETVLKKLKSKYRIAIASSSPSPAIKLLLNKFQLYNHFECICTKDDVVNVKPNPEVLLKTAAKMNLSVNDCIVVEDSERGINAAFQAGMEAYAIPNEFTKKNNFDKASKVLSSLFDLLTVL